MLDKEFCTFLEYHLSRSFKFSGEESTRSIWCDGIALPSDENDYSIKSINDKRHILTRAYLGKDGQEQYTMMILFGNKALSRYARGLDIKNCIPEIEENDWYEIDTTNKKIIIQLL